MGSTGPDSLRVKMPMKSVSKRSLMPSTKSRKFSSKMSTFSGTDSQKLMSGLGWQLHVPLPSALDKVYWHCLNFLLYLVDPLWPGLCRSLQMQHSQHPWWVPQHPQVWLRILFCVETRLIWSFVCVCRWMRKLYWTNSAFKDSTNFDHIKTHYYWSHSMVCSHLDVPKYGGGWISIPD